MILKYVCLGVCCGFNFDVDLSMGSRSCLIIICRLAFDRLDSSSRLNPVDKKTNLSCLVKKSLSFLSLPLEFKLLL